MKSKDWKKFEIKNKTMTLNVLFSPNNNEKIRQTYISKHNAEHENSLLQTLKNGFTLL